MKVNKRISVAVTVLVAVLALVGCARSVTGTALADPSVGGRSVVSDGAVTVGSSGQKITLFLEPLCPACANLEKSSGENIAAAVAGGKLTVEYRMLNFLDRQSSSGDYSTRALQAFVAVGKTSAPSVTMAFLHALYVNQPVEGSTTDLANPQLANLAEGAGVAAGTVGKIRNGTTGVDGKGIGTANGKLLTAVGATGTPTVVHNGQMVNPTAGWLQKILG